jgi:uncharacterized protein (DUF3084 family)
MEYTHNDEVAEMIYQKDREIADLEEQAAKMELRFKFLISKVERLEAELSRVETEYSRGF